MNRRAVLLGLPTFLCGAAPAIVRAESLMPISVPQITLNDIYEHAVALGGNLMTHNQGGFASAYVTLGDERRLIGFGKRIGSYDRFGDTYSIRLGDSPNFSLILKDIRSEVIRALAPPHRWRWHLLGNQAPRNNLLK